METLSHTTYHHAQQKFLPYLWGMETEVFCSLSVWCYLCSYRTYEEWKPNPKTIEEIINQRSYRTYEEWKRQYKVVFLQGSFQFLPYLWGMETHIHTGVRNGVRLFLPYLWGMETFVYRLFICWHNVLTVPMRNGNLSVQTCRWSLLHGSYRTYEEWKLASLTDFYEQFTEFLPYLWGMETSIAVAMFESQAQFLPYLWGMETSLELGHAPQGNYSSYRTYEEWKLQIVHRWFWLCKLFLPYLWGMETTWLYHWCGWIVSSYRTYEEWKHIWNSEYKYREAKVLTVPMRNGNPGPLVLIRYKVTFLPYLWGMETKQFLTSSTSRRFVLTVPMRNGNSWQMQNYPTPWMGSYRTYEEWKQGNNNRNRRRNDWVLTVPMRNGNQPQVQHNRIPLNVLTVPMRNGNTGSSVGVCLPFFVLTVPMRNGNTIL